MSASDATLDNSLSQRQYDFSLVLGGPTYQLWRKARLSGETLQLLRRRIIALVLLAWLPLLLLSILQRSAWGGSTKLPFLADVEIQAKLLVAVPLLVVAELIVHQRLRDLVARFLARGIVPDAAREQFNAAIAAAIRLRNSVTAEVLLLALVYSVGILFVWGSQEGLAVSSWRGPTLNGQFHPSLAGWWLRCVSIPLFQFLLLRWYFRLFIWARFLWQVSRLELRLLPSHPDRCGGLGFLSGVTGMFAPLLVAQGVVLAGMMADRVLFMGANLPQFKLELIGIVAVVVFTVVGPLLAFFPALSGAKRAGLREFAMLAEHYSNAFERKWLRGPLPDEPLLGSADIQSLADLGASYEVVTEMKVAPITLRTVLQLAVFTLVPVAPLLLTIMPMELLVERLFKLIF